jgi:uncharacterized protein (TIGR03083 family)
MEIAEHIDALRRQGDWLADAAEQAGLDAAVPPCPSWQVRDLLRHTGYIHRWATRHVAECPDHVLDGPPEEEILRGGAPDPELLDWFRAGHTALVETLTAADPALECATFMPAPSSLAFWARRQAHETTMHCVDAQLAAGLGDDLADIPAALAADGIDELVTGFGGRKPARLADSPATLVLRTGDGTSPVSWTVLMGHPDAHASRGIPAASAGPHSGERYCEVTGSASDLYLALWNRRPTTTLDIHGDATILATWRDRMHVRWT